MANKTNENQIFLFKKIIVKEALYSLEIRLKDKQLRAFFSTMRKFYYEPFYVIQSRLKGL